MSDVLTKVAEIIEPSLNGMGFDLVRVQYMRGTLQIMAERPETGNLTIEDCTEISNTVSALLDVADPIKGRYNLEVSSPGLDRPLVRLSDYERYADNLAKIELKVPLNGQKNFKGMLKGANGTSVRLEVDGQMVELPFASIMQGKLEMTDALLKQAARGK